VLPVTSGPIRPPISLIAYDVLWSVLYPRVPKPLVLDCPSPGATYTERATHERRGWNELVHSGYAWPTGVQPDIRHALDVMRGPFAELSLRGADVRAMATRQDTVGTLGLIYANHLELRQMDGAFLAESLVGLLPEHHPAELQWQHIQAGTLAAAGAQLRTPDGQSQSHQAILDALRDSGAPQQTVAAIARITTEPVIRRAEFSGATQAGGVRRRSTQSIVVHDTPSGRYLVIRKEGMVLVAGATEGKIVEELRRMLDQKVFTR